jgi:Tfp pilus assembly protein PilF
MKQTAVEWLIEELEMNILWTDKARKAVHKAKAMDKERMIEFANNYGFHICGYDYERAEQYYTETFKSE